MTEEQLRLIASILDGLCASDSLAYMPYWSYSVDLKQCRFCGACGSIEYAAYVEPKHTPDCIVSMNQQLQQTLSTGKTLELERYVKEKGFLARRWGNSIHVSKQCANGMYCCYSWTFSTNMLMPHLLVEADDIMARIDYAVGIADSGGRKI